MSLYELELTIESSSDEDIWKFIQFLNSQFELKYLNLLKDRVTFPKTKQAYKDQKQVILEKQRDQFRLEIEARYKELTVIEEELKKLESL